ncbi:TetR/AcrR family transcriptional regulator [Actinophytocola gossypii]|uniref:TetR family transcriptional regulator n=1 Tax=Actinophytocola gossypii TaxID=2812003 RepID=A0ABT2JF28_9PSEU|nr:TetR/AcrR family transcriptional regulator [Actinophytocola gossypii]MCT2586468.1 TetR family transcriptional regulator [Actinophytocola gossypii]
MRPENQSGEQTRSFIEQARRAQIVRAAVETIAELGFAKSSFVRIAGRAGISPGLISYHFAGKDELIAQVAADIGAAMNEAIEERAAGARSYLDALRAMIRGLVLFCAEHRTEMYALREIAENAPASGGAAVDRNVSVDQLAGLLREGQEHGEFRAFDPHLMAVTLNAALEAAPRELYSRPETDAGRYAEELAETFALAVRRTGRGRRRHG